MKKVITRIPPSPTGKFHIGTARTALFNYLFAKHNKGDFILRFEDTDTERSTLESENDIREGLVWLGLKWDNDKVVRQMERLDVYKKHADKLIKDGLAFEKEGAIWFKAKEFAEKHDDKGFKIRERWEGEKEGGNAREGYVVKLNEKDLVLGEITGIIEDFVIMRSNDVPIYHFAVVIDDHDMGITHVIRGQEHFGNTPKQFLLQKALGFETPQYAHIPLILNKDKSKISKRKNAVSQSDYKNKGYLPEAIINFLALLGWNPGDEREFFTLEELIKEFKLERVQKSPAIFDIDKLNSINSHYIKDLKTEQLINQITGLSENAKVMDAELFEKAVIITKDRLKYLTEFDELTSFLINQPEYDPEILIFKKSDKEKTLLGIQSTVDRLQSTEKEWGNIEDLNKILAEVVSEGSLDNGDVFWPVRVALSGLEKSPSPTELLWALDKDESLKRLGKAINKLKK